MHAILPETRDSFVALEIGGTLKTNDYQDMVPLLEDRIAKFGKIALLMDLRDFHAITPGALWADTKFDLKHTGDFTRIAVVGDKRWHEWFTGLMKPFTSAEIRYFETPERQAACAWASGVS